MSANAPSPLFNLVREDTMETTLGLNYNSGSDEQDFFDEVCLKNPDGEAACHTVDQAYVDKDVRYEYVDGTLAKATGYYATGFPLMLTTLATMCGVNS